MGLPNVLQTGKSGMVAAKAGIATTGHNIANATTEGFSRQRIHQQAVAPEDGRGGHIQVGRGTLVNRVDRINDEYIEKQIRNSNRDLAHAEEKDIVLRQTEDIFNEMNGDGLNRLVAHFFNEFRKLANDPDNEAIRQSVREASQAMVNDFHRIRNEVEDVRKHIDARIEGDVREINRVADEIKELNVKIRAVEVSGGSPNDLLDKRDLALKNLGSYMAISVHPDAQGLVMVDIDGVGPLINGPTVEKFDVFRTPKDDQGKPENALDVAATVRPQSVVTHVVKGGKLGALLEARDKTLSTVLDRVDEMAYTLAQSVNAIHSQGFTRNGAQGVGFFNNLDRKARAAEFINLSDAVRSSVNNIASAAQPDSPGDNRVAIAISGLQNLRMMNEGKSTIDDYYNSIISDVGVTTQQNRQAMSQQKDIVTQLNKMRDQISGVSIDEETTNLLQYQHAFDASANVIRVADECMKMVLSLGR